MTAGAAGVATVRMAIHYTTSGMFFHLCRNFVNGAPSPATRTSACHNFLFTASSKKRTVAGRCCS